MIYEVPGIEKVDHHERNLQNNIQNAKDSIKNIESRLADAQRDLDRFQQELLSAESDLNQDEERMIILRARRLLVRDQESVVRGFHLILDGLRESYKKNIADLHASQHPK